MARKYWGAWGGRTMDHELRRIYIFLRRCRTFWMRSFVSRLVCTYVDVSPAPSSSFLPAGKCPAANRLRRRERVYLAAAAAKRVYYYCARFRSGNGVTTLAFFRPLAGPKASLLGLSGPERIGSAPLFQSVSGRLFLKKSTVQIPFGVGKTVVARVPNCQGLRKGE